MTKTIVYVGDGQFPVAIKQTGPNAYTVTYGIEAYQNKPYEVAARKLGECIMHALCCEGKLTTNEPDWRNDT